MYRTAYKTVLAFLPHIAIANGFPRSIMHGITFPCI